LGELAGTKKGNSRKGVCGGKKMGGKRGNRKNFDQGDSKFMGRSGDKERSSEKGLINPEGEGGKGKLEEGFLALTKRGKNFEEKELPSSEAR